MLRVLGSLQMICGHLQVYDISAEDGAKQSFEFVQSAQYWEVPISGQGPPENPVPAADGSTYQVCMQPSIMTHCIITILPQDTLHGCLAPLSSKTRLGQHAAISL